RHTRRGQDPPPRPRPRVRWGLRQPHRPRAQRAGRRGLHRGRDRPLPLAHLQRRRLGDHRGRRRARHLPVARRTGARTREGGRDGGAVIVFCVAVPATERLDRLLADQLALSRTQAARLIADKRVTAAGRALRAPALLDRGAEVSVEFPAEAAPRTYSQVTPPQAGGAGGGPPLHYKWRTRPRVA